MYGRGVSDAKGIIAAQCAAAEALRAEGFRIGLLFVSGEERDSAGRHPGQRVARREAGSWSTASLPTTASRWRRRALCGACFRASGKMAHSAYPELGDSAIHKLVRLMASLLEMELPVTEDVGPSTLNIGLIQGGRAPNVIADTAEAQVLVRLVGDSAPIRAAILEAAEGLAEVDFTLEIPFVRLRAVEGLPTMIAKFTTDIPKLSNWGEPLLLGPGSIHVAHTPYEKLAKRELFEAIESIHQSGQAVASFLNGQAVAV